MSDKFLRVSDSYSRDFDRYPRGKGRQMAGSVPFRPQNPANVLHYATQVLDSISVTGFTPSSVGLSSGENPELHLYAAGCAEQ
jgi:hypothetical protein